MITKIILFGSNGMLGNYIKSYFNRLNKYTIINITRNDFEISELNIQNLEKFLIKFNLNSSVCVINCIGLIPQRYIKNDGLYYIINTIFPLYLSNICKKYNLKLIQPTTDCVFKGIKGNYLENDFHDANDSYGISKSLGELGEGTIIRASIIGEELYNKYSFLEFVKNSTGIIKGYDNHLWNGVTCLQYCKIIHKIIDDNLFWNGVRHIYSPDQRSKYELACFIKDSYKLPIEVSRFRTDISVDKTLKSNYSTNDIFKIPSLKQQIEEQSLFFI